MIKIQILDWKKSSTKIVIMVFLALLVLSTFFIISSYRSFLNNSKASVMQRLQSISNTLALQIESKNIEYLDSLLRIGKPKSEVQNDARIISINSKLDKVALVNNIEEPISIIYYNNKNGKFFFIANSAADSIFFSDPYYQVSHDFQTMYEEGGALGPYEDEFGTWLTSLTPIKNDSNKTVGAVEVDLKFDSFISEANSTLYTNLLASIAIFIFTSVVLLRYVRVVLVFEEKIQTKLKLSHDIIEEKNTEIIQSINYALRIQRAILPSNEMVKKHLPNSFIFYQPKDIVAGDFYWMETANDVVLIAACDCTGHGVPGAMVSVVCHNALNRAVREFGKTIPGEILNQTEEIVVDYFSQSEDDIKDGMDISLCSFNPKSRTLQWAGANNPLWLVQNGKLIEIKADKQPIGKIEDSKPFTTHTFELFEGDMIYLFTDGYADQFGGPTGQKKLTRKRFKELVLSFQHQTLNDQHMVIGKFINDYRKEIEQIDDILVMGIKV
ncbi:SpoIIE family protein phosphatase [Aurantibacillus circumpalustris]|uniref:SpoIIE family protein phosphatase n=1 Tax=Aurantibacillus circumpalustris TaxID=3036359 RepID=UPI00295BA0F2|nr:SpoIIE family protein phosphatase [Aurantibacillus circumpalustris]